MATVMGSAASPIVDDRGCFELSQSRKKFCSWGVIEQQVPQAERLKAALQQGDQNRQLSTQSRSFRVARLNVRIR